MTTSAEMTFSRIRSFYSLGCFGTHKPSGTELPYSELTKGSFSDWGPPPKSWPFVSSLVPTKPRSLNKIDFQLCDLCEWSFSNPYPYLYRIDCFIDFKYLLEININQQKFKAGSIMHYVLFLGSQYSQTDKENLITTRNSSTVLRVFPNPLSPQIYLS